MVISEKASRFENGGLPAIGLYGLHETVKTYMRLGGRDIEDYILDLTDYLYSEVQKLDGFSIFCPHQRAYRSGLVSLKLPAGLGLTEGLIREAGIRAKLQGQDRMRVALHYYNNTRDIDRLMEYLKSCIKK